MLCDSFIISRSKKIFIVLELTVPMEENIERWHQEKFNKYSSLVCTGWQVELFMIEVGCRGYIPPRFSSFMRQLGFSSSETRKLRDNIQLVTRKCSYIIWINRFNKDFNSALRVSVDGELLPVPTPTPTTTVSFLSQEAKDRISRNRESALLKLRVNQNRRAALLRLRETRNRKAALLKLRKKRFVYREKSTASPPDIVDSKSVTTPMDGEQTQDATIDSLWTVLDLPGLPLKNSLNKCWFHAGLHLLSAVPPLRDLCTPQPKQAKNFENSFLSAVYAIFHSRRPMEVSSFFHLVRDFTGANNRYGQVAVPDFIEHLCAHSPHLSSVVNFTFSSKVSCSQCSWVSETLCRDMSLKLHIPSSCNSISLQNLVEFNSTSNLTGDNAVYCGTCKTKTSQKVSRSYNPDLCLVEVIRVTRSSGNIWGKSHASLSFSLKDLRLPGFERGYRVVGTCHHRGTLNSGHWITKICTNNGWFELDDLRGNSFPTSPPGTNDDSVTLILIIAEDKLRS